MFNFTWRERKHTVGEDIQHGEGCRLPATVGAQIDAVDPNMCLPVDCTEVEQYLLPCPSFRH